jgi:hypothetical protein
VSWLVLYLLAGLFVVGVRVAQIISFTRLAPQLRGSSAGVMVWAFTWLLWPIEAVFLVWMIWKWATAFLSLWLTLRRLGRVAQFEGETDAEFARRVSGDLAREAER